MKMTKLEELIKELCPNGVEYVALGKVTHLLRGKRLTKMQLLGDGKYPVYHGSLVPLGYYNEYNREGDTVIVVNTGGMDIVKHHFGVQMVVFALPILRR